jgi:hypothetical protein
VEGRFNFISSRLRSELKASFSLQLKDLASIVRAGDLKIQSF